MRTYDSWGTTFRPGKTRVSKGRVAEVFRILRDKSIDVYLRLTPHDWSLSQTKMPGSLHVGRFTSSVSFEDLHAAVEVCAAEIAAPFARSRIAA